MPCNICKKWDERHVMVQICGCYRGTIHKACFTTELPKFLPTGPACPACSCNYDLRGKTCAPQDTSDEQKDAPAGGPALPSPDSTPEHTCYVCGGEGTPVDPLITACDCNTGTSYGACSRNWAETYRGAAPDVDQGDLTDDEFALKQVVPLP